MSDDGCTTRANAFVGFFCDARFRTQKTGQEAFESKDKLARTPQTRPRVPTYPADYNSMLHDSFTHMPSPLSSTRIESGAVNREDMEDLATKLFADKSGATSTKMACPNFLLYKNWSGSFSLVSKLFQVCFLRISELSLTIFVVVCFHRGNK